MKRNSLLLILLLGLLTCCKSEDAPIKAIKPNEPGSINEEYMSRAETTFANIFKYYWSDRVEMMFGTYPNTLGTHDEPNSPDYNSHAYLWGLGGVLSGFNAIVQNTDNVDFRTTYESQLKRTLLKYYNTTKEPKTMMTSPTPIITPLRKPIVNIKIRITMTTDSTRLTIKTLMASFTFSG